MKEMREDVELSREEKERRSAVLDNITYRDLLGDFRDRLAEARMTFRAIAACPPEGRIGQGLAQAALDADGRAEQDTLDEFGDEYADLILLPDPEGPDGPLDPQS